MAGCRDCPSRRDGECGTRQAPLQTPLTAAVREAADILDFKSKPAEIVLLTDGEETCGGDPCKLAESLEAEGANITVHVIGFRPKNMPASEVTFTSRCLADVTGGQFITATDTAELTAALQKILGCPFVTQLQCRAGDMVCR